jgi:hypothetical protein
VELLNVKSLELKEGRAGSPSRPFLRSELISREKKPHDWSVSAGGSEIRPYRGLRTPMSGFQVPGPSHKSEGSCERCRLKPAYFFPNRFSVPFNRRTILAR